MDSVRDGIRPTVLLVCFKHLSVSAFLHAAMIPDPHPTYFFLSIEGVDKVDASVDTPLPSTLSGILWTSCYNASWKRSQLSARAKAFGMSFFRARKVELMHRGLAVLPGWADASALPKKVHTQLTVLSSFPTEILFELF